MEMHHLTGTNPQANLIELCQKLRKEKLYTASEYELVIKKIEHIAEKVIFLFQELWQTWHLTLNLNEFETNSSNHYADGVQAGFTPQMAMIKSRRLNHGLKFIAAKSHFEKGSNYENIFKSFLNDLRKNPSLLAACLNYGSVLNIENSKLVVHTLIITLYGNSIASNNHQYILELLNCLSLLVLTDESKDPRKMFMKSKCTFTQAFSFFVDLIPKTKLFITTAFHETVIVRGGV